MGKRTSHGNATATATGTRPPDSSEREEPQEWWRRREDIRLLLGTGAFVDDITRPGQLWMRVVRSSVAHGVIESIKTAEARAMPGIRAILTASDLDEVPVVPLRLKANSELEAFTQPVLARSKVRYVGEPIAVVVATSPRSAEDAAELVQVNIDSLPAGLEVDVPHESAVWDGSDGDELCSYTAAVGDFAEVLRLADCVVSEEFTTGRDTGLPLETRGLIAEWSQDDATLHLWGPTKFLRFTRESVARWFKLSEEHVHCHHVDVGGMFGTRGELYPEDFLVPWAARVVNAPVKWIEDRSEHLVSINHSRGQKHRITLAAAASGEFLGLRSESWVDMGAYSRPIGGRVVEISAESLPGPYRWPTLDLHSRGIATNKTPVGTMRGPGTFDTTFARERLVDMVAAELGRDPIELRRQNLITAAELPYVQEFGDQMHSAVYDSGDYPQLLSALLADMDYDRIRAEVAVRRASGELVGIGMAMFLDHSGLGKEESIRLDLSEEGVFTFYTTASEIGQGLATMIADVGAAELGVPAHRVRIVTNQTAEFDGGNGTFSSRGAIFVGSAAHDAAKQMRALLHRAQPLSDPGLEASWQAVAPCTVIGRHANQGPTYGFGAHLAVVRIDPDTLDVRVERLGVAYDCGRVLNRASVEGQLVGATIQGLGGTLLQELTYDDAGQPQSTTFMDFLLPTVNEVPKIDVTVLELPGTVSNPLGVKGVGEAGIMGVGGSVANAAAAALGHSGAITRLPIRPDDLMSHVPGLPQRGILKAADHAEPTRQATSEKQKPSTRPATSRLTYIALILAAGIVIRLVRSRSARGNHG